MTALVGAGLLGGHALAVTVPVPTVPTVTVPTLPVTVTTPTATVSTPTATVSAPTTSALAAHGRATRATYGRRASPALDPSGIGAACRNSSLFGRRLDAGR